MPVFSSYRNQSIDLHNKSIGWFLYEGNTTFNGLICSNLLNITSEIQQQDLDKKYRDNFKYFFY